MCLLNAPPVVLSPGGFMSEIDPLTGALPAAPFHAED